MFGYLNLFFAVLGIASGFPIIIPIVNIIAAGFCFAIDRADAVDAAKHKARMKALRQAHEVKMASYSR